MGIPKRPVVLAVALLGAAALTAAAAWAVMTPPRAEGDESLVANPVPSPRPDAAQQELIDAGGTYHVSIRGGFSLVAPSAWHAGTSGTDAAGELHELAESSGRRSVETAIEQLRDAEVDFAAFDMARDAPDDEVVTAVNAWRWSRYAGEPVEQLADLLLEREGMPDATRQAIDLPAGEAIRLAWSTRSARGDDIVAVTFVFTTEQSAYGLELRTDRDLADAVVIRFDELASSFRSIPELAP